MEKDNLILKLTFDFSIAIMEFAEVLESQKKFVFSNQLLKSGTSIGANINEVQGGESLAEFYTQI